MADSLKALLKYLKNQAIDLIWPRLIGPQEKPPELDEQPHVISRELLEVVEKILVQRMVQAENRMVAVDRKLLPLFRLTSLLATLTAVSLAGAAGLIPTNEGAEQALVWVAVCLILYGMIQLICAVNATIRGLEASRYASQTKESILPLDRERTLSYRRRQVRDVMYVTEQHDWATNRKVSHMMVAYRAIRNSVLPLVGLIATATVLVSMRLGIELV